MLSPKVGLIVIYLFLIPTLLKRINLRDIISDQFFSLFFFLATKHQKHFPIRNVSVKLSESILVVAANNWTKMVLWFCQETGIFHVKSYTSVSRCAARINQVTSLPDVPTFPCGWWCSIRDLFCIFIVYQLPGKVHVVSLTGGLRITF